MAFKYKHKCDIGPISRVIKTIYPKRWIKKQKAILNNRCKEQLLKITNKSEMKCFDKHVIDE